MSGSRRQALRVPVAPGSRSIAPQVISGPVTAARLCSRSFVSSLVRDGLLHPKRHLGQNFLVDRRVLDRTVEALGPAGLAVVEIGAGIGALTLALAEAGAQRVVAVEKDRTLAAFLASHVAGHPAITVRVGDALTEDLRRLGLEAARTSEEAFAGEVGPGVVPPAGSPAPAPSPSQSRASPPIGLPGLGRTLADSCPVVAGNLPYSVTTPLLLKILEPPLFWSRAVVMVQLEVAKRILAGPGGKDYGALTLAVAALADASLAFTAVGRSFYPASAVDTGVLVLIRRPRPAGDLDPAGLTRLSRVVRAAFGQRRKMLVNSVAAGLGLERPDVARLISAAGLTPERRAETLSLGEFLALELALRPHLI